MSRCDNTFYRCKALYHKKLVVFKPLAFQPERLYHLHAALFDTLVIILLKAVITFLGKGSVIVKHRRAVAEQLGISVNDVSVNDGFKEHQRSRAVRKDVEHLEIYPLAVISYPVKQAADIIFIYCGTYGQGFLANLRF